MKSKKSSRSDFILDSDEDGEFCVIPLGGKHSAFAIIDVDDYDDISRYHWHAKGCNHSETLYAVRKRKEGDIYEVEYMHRQILGLKTTGIFGDHRNGDGLDNRRFNLRVATASQNQWNQRKRTGSSKYKGVSWHKHNKKWGAGIRYRDHQIYLGQFEEETEAALAYDKAARLYFGVFARLNFPEQKEKTMAYKMTDGETVIAVDLCQACAFDDLGVISENLGRLGCDELKLMCGLMQCNISQLAQRIKQTYGVKQKRGQ